MNDKKFEEDLSISYLRAVAAIGKVEFELLRNDTVSKDVLLSKNFMVSKKDEIESIIFVQLKATYSLNSYKETDDEIIYNLKVKNYNDLCGKSSNVKILALLILPPNQNEWVLQNVDNLILKRCMYWWSPKGFKKSTNKEIQTIRIPKSNVLDSNALLDILNRVANGEIV